MAPLSFVLTAALLALGGVDAKRKDKVSYSKYIDGTCQGHPLSGKIFDLKLEKDRKSKCEQITGSGFRFHKNRKDKHSKWIDDVNEGRDTCGATLYRDLGCRPENAVGQVSLPADFTQCNSFQLAPGSVQFWCRPKYSYEDHPFKQEIEMPVTSYSIGADGQAHPSVYTTVFNETHHVYQTAPVTYPAIKARAEPTHKASLEPRRKEHNVKGIWMKHPWTSSNICFKCWTHHEASFGKFDCRSGHGDKYAVDCGAQPAEVPAVTTYQTTYTNTINFWQTVTDEFGVVPTSTAAAEKRSPHKDVVLHHPYLSGKMVCADAEWENEGKSKAEVRIQDVEAFEKCAKKHALNIDVGIPEYTSTSATTTTAFITHTTRPTWVTPRPPQTTTTSSPPSSAITSTVTTTVISPTTPSSSITSTVTTTVTSPPPFYTPLLPTSSSAITSIVTTTVTSL